MDYAEHEVTGKTYNQNSTLTDLRVKNPVLLSDGHDRLNPTIKRITQDNPTQKEGSTPLSLIP